MYKAMKRLLIVAAVVCVGNVVSLSPYIIGPAFAQNGPPFTPPGPPPGRPPAGVPVPLLGVGWPAIALAGAALAGYRLRQRKRSMRPDESAAETPPERN